MNNTQQKVYHVVKLPKTLYAFLFFCALIVLASILFRTFKDIRMKAADESAAMQIALTSDYLSQKLYHVLANRFPPQLINVPFLDEDEILLSTKTIPVREVKAPYNGCITSKEDGNFLLFFRYDENHSTPIFNPQTPFRTRIGVIELTPTLNRTSKPLKRIITGSDYSEDPRVIRTDQGYELVYNDLLKTNGFYCRLMHLARLNKDSLDVEAKIDLDQHTGTIEKNWSPFLYKNEDGNWKTHLSYSINPHKVLALEKDESISHLTFKNFPNITNLSWWTKHWGTPRGGTPAQLVDGEYLSFFHSMFYDTTNNMVWYVMGAYTFESTPPFRLKKITRYPIVFKGIYSTPLRNTASPGKRCIYPAGFVVAKDAEGREVIHVSCGENDSAIKILTFDKNKFLNSLQDISEVVPIKDFYNER